MRVSPVFGRTEISAVRPADKVLRSVRPDDEHNRVGEDEPDPRPNRRRRQRQVEAVQSAASQSSNGVLSALIDLQEHAEQPGRAAGALQQLPALWSDPEG